MNAPTHGNQTGSRLPHTPGVADEQFGSTFVKDPDLIPNRVAGQRWGDGEVVLDLPAGPYRIGGLSEAQVEIICSKYSSRAKEGSTKPAAIDVKAFRIEPSEFLPHPLSGETYRMNFDYGSNRIRCVSHDFIGLIQLDSDHHPRRCGLFSGEEVGLLEGGSLENMLRVVMAYSSLAQGGLLLHSAAVLRDGDAYVFVGSSGAGKSTVSRLSADAGHGVLSDDINVLLPHPELDEKFVIEQVPFAGDFRDAPTVLGRHRVAGIFALRHADNHRIEPISAALGSALLTAHAPFINNDPECSERLLTTSAALVAGLPTHKLDFLPDAGFWDLF